MEQFLTRRAKHLRPASLKRYRSLFHHLQHHFGSLSLSQISPRIVEAYIDIRLAQGRSRSTINQELHALWTASLWASEMDYLSEKPIHRWKFLRDAQPTRPRVLTPEVESRLVLACNAHLRPMVVFALHTGLGRSELTSLRWGDVDPDTRILTVRKEVSKSKKEGRVPLNDSAMAILERIKTPLWPPSTDGSIFRYRDAASPFRVAVKRAGLRDVSLHTLPHTFATRLVVAGVPLGMVKELMRHADIKMTMRYSHPQMDSLQAAVNLLGRDHATEQATITA